MGPHYLSQFFQPENIALVGASERLDSVGYHLLNNLRSAGFQGRVYPVNNKRASVHGSPAYRDLESIPDRIDLAVIATPAQTVMSLLKQCANRNVRAIVICSSFQLSGIESATLLQQQISHFARQAEIRIIGPNSYGLARPAHHFNLTYGNDIIKPGSLAMLSQSGAMCSAIIDWATSQDIGFSAIATIGDAIDIDFGDVLDFLSTDRSTRSIIMYVESIHNARRFLSGLKAAASLKPIVLIKAGRYPASAQAVLSHTGNIVGSDDVFDAAIARAGVVRVNSIAQLFAAAQILSHNYRIADNRLAIVTNAGGPGIMCADQAQNSGIRMAQFSTATLIALKQYLAPCLKLENPLNLQGNASAEHFKCAVQLCLNDGNVDGVLAIVTPQALTLPTSIATAIVREAQHSQKPVLASWTGGSKVQQARKLFQDSRVAHFATPESAVNAFSFLTQHRRNQILLKQIPLPSYARPDPDLNSVATIINDARARHLQQLTVLESKQILSAFHIPVSQPYPTRTLQEALRICNKIKFPLVLKIDNPDIRHKTDIGGVRLNVRNPEELATHYAQLVTLIHDHAPHHDEIRINLESTVEADGGRELMIGMLTDPVFGPAISLGMGGTLVEIMQDKVVSVPPLNRYMIEQMIKASKAGRYLQQFRHLPPANLDALIDVMLRVSDLVSEIPDVIELEINPLIVDADGAVAVDAHITIRPQPIAKDYRHMTIHPYPSQLTRHYRLRNGVHVCIRPIKPEDAVLEQDFVKRLSERSKYFRFMQSIQSLTPEMLVRFTQIDYDREMAFVVISEDVNMPSELGVGRYMMNPDGNSAEFAVVVADDCQSLGIGTRIMTTLIETARNKGLKQLDSEVLTVNKAMLGLARKLGFRTEPIADDYEVVKVIKDL